MEPAQGISIPEPGVELAPGFRILGRLHRTSALDVYDVWSEERACRCVAKVLHPDRLDRASDRNRLQREGRLLLRLTHPHIVRAYAVFDRPRPVLILETLPGATLGRLLAEKGRFRLADLVFLGLHIGSALYYLHRQGYLHLDLKPSNIIVHTGLAKLIDLSIARRPGPGRRGVGTRGYMAPEQARGDMLTPAADVWGVGAVLFEAASGAPPFRVNRDDAGYEQTERRADSIRARRRLVARFAALVDACLEPDPTSRPTVEELLTSLAALL